MEMWLELWVFCLKATQKRHIFLWDEEEALRTDSEQGTWQVQ